MSPSLGSNLNEQAITWILHQLLGENIHSPFIKRRDIISRYMDSLLLIPDISGFTAFVNETEVKHSKHIISELLELIIESDQLGMTVSEIEGDAVFFYKKERVPTLDELIDQAKRTFISFHAHLKNYESRRICPCGACCTANSLTLKFIALRSEIDFINVKSFQKPYGSGVILAHRLLKNDIDDKEYLLINSEYYSSAAHETTRTDGESFLQGKMDYPDFGEITYQYLPLSDWLSEVPVSDPIPSFERIPNPVRCEGVIQLPLFELYELISNLDLRLRWNTGVESLEYEEDRVNRVGMRHQCVVQGNLIDFETIVAEFGSNTLVYGEQVERHPLVKRFALFWILTEEAAVTHLAIELHYHLKPFPMSLIAGFFRWNAKKQLNEIFSRISEVAQEQAGSKGEQVGR